MKVTIPVIACTLILTAVLGSNANAKDELLPDDRLGRGAAISAPNSLDMITGTLTLNEQEIDFAVPDGGTLRIEPNAPDGVQKAVVLSRSRDNSAEVVAHLYHVETVSIGNEQIAHRGKATLSTGSGAPRAFPPELEGLGLRIGALQPAADNRQALPVASYIRNPDLLRQSLCCVSCDDHTVCACRVTAPCGSCNSADCAGGGTYSPEYRRQPGR